MFWLFSASDLSVSAEGYQRELDKLERQISSLGDQSEMSKKRAQKEEERLRTAQQKLNSELSRQQEHVARLRSLLLTMKEELFANGRLHGRN